MKSRRFSISISAALLWMTAIGFSFATFRLSASVTQAVFALGCCAVVLGLMQQAAWLWGLPTLEKHPNTVRLAIAWRVFVVIAMTWSFAVLAASHLEYLPAGLHGGYEADANPMFGTQHLAIAGLAVGCLCGVMTAPWLRLNRMAQTPWTVGGFLFATLAGIPMALYAAYECGAITGLVDIATQGVLIGTQEPVTVSSGALPINISRGNALNSLFVERSIRAWGGVTLALIIVSIAARNSTRPRVVVYSCLLAFALAIPAVFLIHWLVLDGYRRVAPHLWLVHHWPFWHAISLSILPLSAVSVILSIGRRGINLPAEITHPVFLCDSYLTYLAFTVTPVLWICESILTLYDSEVWAMVVAVMGKSFVLTFVLGEMVSPTGGMLLTVLAAMSLGAMMSRYRHGATSPRILTTIRPGQIPLVLFVAALVVLAVICTIPFGVSLMHVGI